jgi:hypothetical protein
MAVERGPQFDEHLPLFMNAREVLATVGLPEADAWSDKPEETTEQLLARKLSEAKGGEYIYDDDMEAQPKSEKPDKSLYDQIKEKGITNPLNIYVNTKDKEKVLFDGHHRLAVMNDIDPEAYFPVNRVNEDFDDDD